MKVSDWSLSFEYHTNGPEFLRGNASTDECEPLFKQYKNCLTVSVLRSRLCSSVDPVQTALKERGIDTMLEEARESNKENDAENMRRSCESSII